MLRELYTVDPAYLTGLAIFSGSVVGALTSLTSAWLTKQHEARHQRASEAKLWRQRLYAQFIDEASKLYLDALVRDQAEALAMVGLYALLSKIRMTSTAEYRRERRGCDPNDPQDLFLSEQEFARAARPDPEQEVRRSAARFQRGLP